VALNTPRGRYRTAARSPPEGGRAAAASARVRAEAHSRVAKPAVLATPEGVAGPAVSGRWTPRDPPTFDWHSRSEELLCMPTATEATVDTGSRGPEGPSKGGRSASPEGSTVRPLALPEGGVCRAALCTEMHPLCAARLPKEPPATGQTAVSMSYEPNGAAGPKSDPAAEAAGRAEARGPRHRSAWGVTCRSGSRPTRRTRRVTVLADAEAPVPRAEARGRPLQGTLRRAPRTRDPDHLHRAASCAVGATSAASTEAEVGGGPEDRTEVGLSRQRPLPKK